MRLFHSVEKREICSHLEKSIVIKLHSEISRNIWEKMVRRANIPNFRTVYFPSISTLCIDDATSIILRLKEAAYTVWKLRKFTLTFFGNNFVNAMVLRMKLLNTWFDKKFFSVSVNFSFFYTVACLLKWFSWEVCAFSLRRGLEKVLPFISFWQIKRKHYKIPIFLL